VTFISISWPYWNPALFARNQTPIVRSSANVPNDGQACDVVGLGSTLGEIRYASDYVLHHHACGMAPHLEKRAIHNQPHATAQALDVDQVLGNVGSLLRLPLASNLGCF
jgi:hypothetical protein